MPERPLTAEDASAALAEEYGQYVAVAPIESDGVRWYNAGDPVPAANVEAHGYLDAGLVAKTTTKAGRAAASGQST